MASPIEEAQPTSEINKPADEAASSVSSKGTAKSATTKTADSIVADLDFDKQLRNNLATFIPLLFIALGIVGAGAALSTDAAINILAAAANNTKLYLQIKSGTVPKTTYFLSGTIIGGFGLFVLMVVTVHYLDKRERIVNRRKIIEEEARLQKLKAKPKNIFDVLLSAARGNKSPAK